MSSPLIWSEFTKVRDGKELKFRTQELPEEKYNELFDLFMEYFATDETLHKAAGIAETKKSLNEYRQHFIGSLIEDELHLDACYLVKESGDLELVAGSIMAMERKGSNDFSWKKMYEKVETQQLKKLIKSLEYMLDQFNVKEKYNLDKYFGGRGICVSKDYRRLGLAAEIIKAREHACRHYGVPMTGAWMSSYGTQKAAAKLGWVTIHKVKHEDLAKAGDITFDSSAPPTSNLMVFRVRD